MSERPWYHWLAQIFIVAMAASVGLLNITMGASTDSPHFVADNIFVRMVGVALVISAVLMALRRRIGYLAATACFLLSGIELIMMWLLGQPIVGFAVLVVLITFIFLSLVATWSGRIFVDRNKRSEEN